MANSGNSPSALALALLFNPGAALADASATISPGTDKASMYTMAAGTATAARTITIAMTGSPLNSQTCLIVIKPQSQTITINNDIAGLILAVAANTQTVFVWCYNAGTHFALNVSGYCPN